ncbi:MAG: DUF1329 domain-containing protein [Alphaproteobacteria bacterium]|nr:DUF1329 domain-containing protein [Alphaproteobacteria bacterium]
MPAWTGGLSGVPEGITFDPKTQHPPNPFPDDKIKYTITSKNMADYDALLTDGHKAMLKRVPGFKMNVYQSRRSCTVPKFVQEATKRNATTVELATDGARVAGGNMGTPFPITPSATQLMWNHRLRYVPTRMMRYSRNVPVKADGSYEMISLFQSQLSQWSDSAIERNGGADLYVFRKDTLLAPPALAGVVDLVHEPISGPTALRKLWQYSPGTRRVRRVPDISYDSPGSSSGGMSTVDSLNGFDGPLDRYDWSTVGRRVSLMPYNSYMLVSTKLEALIGRGSLNPDSLRYESHRVWVVEAKLRADQKHAYHRRVLHLDEDTYAILAAELYDGRGRLWRLQETHTINFYHVPVCLPVVETVYDLQGKSGYLASSLINDERPLDVDAQALNPASYAPEAIRSFTIR